MTTVGCYSHFACLYIKHSKDSGGILSALLHMAGSVKTSQHQNLSSLGIRACEHSLEKRRSCWQRISESPPGDSDSRKTEMDHPSCTLTLITNKYMISKFTKKDTCMILALQEKLNDA